MSELTGKLTLLLGLTSLLGGNIFNGFSVTMAWFVIGAFSQFYLRKYRPNWFIKYNYILSAAMDGGTQVLVFILSFAVFGAGGKEIKFPAYCKLFSMHTQ
jgi:hypothetical protein